MQPQVLPDLCAAIGKAELQVAVFQDGNLPDLFPECFLVKVIQPKDLRRNRLQFLFPEVHAGAGHSHFFFASAYPVDISFSPDSALLSRKRMPAYPALYFPRKWIRRHSLRPFFQDFLNFCKNLPVNNRFVAVRNVILRKLAPVLHLVMLDGVCHIAFLQPPVTDVNLVFQNGVQMAVSEIISPPGLCPSLF